MLGVESLHRWFFSTAGASLREARAPFLLCTIGWFLLTVFGLQTGIPEAWRIDLAAMCFGAGTFSYTVALVSILLNFSSGGKADVGQPSLFMLVAPPSVAAVGLASLRGRFDSAAASVLGCAPICVSPVDPDQLVVLCALRVRRPYAQHGNLFAPIRLSTSRCAQVCDARAAAAAAHWPAKGLWPTHIVGLALGLHVSNSGAGEGGHPVCRCERYGRDDGASCGPRGTRHPDLDGSHWPDDMAAA